MQGLIESGYFHGLLAGNALATHDLEAAFFGTGLGQDIYSQTLKPLGHYNHLYTINEVRSRGSIASTIEELGIKYEAQDAMREHARKATTVVALATQLHSIAFGNMVPSYKVLPDGTVRPVFFYIVDMTEFSADKLANRGSAQAVAILTNAQDFIVNLWNNLRT